jgi:hypothetical protein
MTTACLAQAPAAKAPVSLRLPKREWMEAAVAAIAFVLLLPGASLLMAVLSANGAA